MNPGDTIFTGGRPLTITGASITAGNINTSSTTNGVDGGAVILQARWQYYSYQPRWLYRYWD
jgi:hypothetical protein